MTVFVGRGRAAPPVVPAAVGHSAHSDPTSGHTVRWWWFAVAAVVYGLVLLTLDPKGQIGSDAAAKVSALEHMRVTGSAVPEVPYWAREQDPEGRLFPVYNSVQVEGQWIPVTTLPMLEAMAPLYRLGGVRLALTLPIAGALACAWAAAALARRVGASPRAAFFVVALASPITVYAMTVWEHTLGLAFVAWASVLLLDIRRGVRSWHWAVLAGLAFGVAATMRTEALVYSVVLAATFGIMLALERRSLMAAAQVGVATLAGLSVPLFCNTLLERAVLGVDLRSGRVGGAASASGAQPLARLRDGAVGLFSVVNDSVQSIALGALFAAAIGCAVWFWDDPRRRDRARQLMVVACLIAVVVCATGLGFVPGLLPTAPIAVAAVLVLRTRDPGMRELGAAAVIAIVVVWATQYTTNVVPQWSGRYVLASGLLLMVLGLRDAVPLGARRTLVVLSIAITAYGLLWTGQRTHEVADFFATIDATHSDVVISRDAYLMRESGAAVVGPQWLTVQRAGDAALAFEIARTAHATTVLVIQRDTQSDVAPPDCFQVVGRERLNFLRTVPFDLVSYRAIDGCQPAAA